MQLLEDRIRSEGRVAPGNVLRVDSFINHQIDVDLMAQLAAEFHRLYEGVRVDKVLTIEASGIASACFVAYAFHVPLVFAKKSKTSNLPDDVYAATVRSYTHGNVNEVLVSKAYLKPSEHVLIIDDFLAHGEALQGLISLVEQAGGTVAGAGILIEKAFQNGGSDVRARGYRVESLARIAAMSDDGSITFC